jgi:hypothetical protein
MKFALAILLVLSNIAMANPVEKDVVINIHDALVPERVSNQSDAKVVLSGMFPNTCYRWDRAEIKDLSSTTHIIRAHSIVTMTMCLMVLVPFSKEVNLGRLARGEHTLRFINGDETSFERTLKVE